MPGRRPCGSAKSTAASFAGVAVQGIDTDGALRLRRTTAESFRVLAGDVTLEKEDV